MEGTLGEIRLFAGNYAPVNWAFCDGRSMSTMKFPALFQIIKGSYGSDFQTTFALPDLRGRTMIHPGGPYHIGFAGGEATHQLTKEEMPQHNHIVEIQGSTQLGSTNDPSGKYLGSTDTGTLPSIYANAENCSLKSSAIRLDDTGGNVPHNNMQPYLGLNYIICIRGEYPTKNA